MRKLIELDSIPTVLHVPKNAVGNKIIVGFSDGRVTLFRINPMLTEGSLNFSSFQKALLE